MVITRDQWLQHGDLLAWLATTYPGLSRAQYEAGFALLADPDITDHNAAQVELLLAGCAQGADSAATLAGTGRGRVGAGDATEAPAKPTRGNDADGEV